MYEIERMVIMAQIITTSAQLTFLILVIGHFFINQCNGDPTFAVSFQPNGTWSTDHWMRYNYNITGVGSNFTICQWIKIRYFSTDISSVWAYCYMKSTSQKQIPCWHLFMEADKNSAGRNINLVARSPFWYVEAQSLEYRHRQWNHICLTYSYEAKFGKLFYNGDEVDVVSAGNYTKFENGKSVLRSSFEIAQEPDIFLGGYDPAQLFNGELSELNMWSKVLTNTEILALANCSNLSSGDIIAWQNDSFTVNEASMYELENSSALCERKKTMVIFPEKTSFDGAKSLCDIHGGKLVTPFSKREETEIMEILEEHRESCLEQSTNLQQGKAVWLGMEKENRVWFAHNAHGNLKTLNYTNWDPARCTTSDCGYDSGGCPYMLTDKKWAFGLHWGTCSSLELCTICSFTETPIFTLKGICSERSQLDLNYYFLVNQSHQISSYDGYKKSNMTLSNSSWILQDAGAHATTISDFAIGRKQWMYIDRACGMKTNKQTSLTLSRCQFGTEFTCDSGQCISMSKRCNKINECNDNSDEEDCHLVKLSKSYDKIRSPVKFGMDHNPVNLTTQVTVLNVDIIDSLHMQIGITFEAHVKWNDDRLNFENIEPNGKNLLPTEIANKLWLPCENIIHDNAILGKIIEDKHRDVGVTIATTERPVDITKSIENYLYKGSDAELFMTQRFKIVYNCVFHLAKFPFDEHICNFVMLLKTQQNNSMSFVSENPGVSLRGQRTVFQFNILNVTSTVMNDDNSTKFIFSMLIHHHIMDQIIGTFLPTILLWFLACFTLFIDIGNFSDRFVGTVTTLLVLVALLSSLSDDMPKTSYFKFIDLWFLWYISAILMITVYHIFLNHIPNNKVEYILDGKKVQKLSKRAKVNRIAIVIFAISTLVFDIVYFLMSA